MSFLEVSSILHGTRGLKSRRETFRSEFEKGRRLSQQGAGGSALVSTYCKPTMCQAFSTSDHHVMYLSQFRALSFRQLTLPKSHSREAACLDHQPQGDSTPWGHTLLPHQPPWAEVACPSIMGKPAVLAGSPCPTWGWGMGFPLHTARGGRS